MATVSMSDFGKGTIYSVSRGTGYSVADIISANPGIDINDIASNATINLPNAVMESVNIDDYGSIYSISQKTGVSVDDIIASNSGIDINSIPSGASINLPSGSVISTPQSALKVVDIDDYGSVYQISQKTGVPVSDIIAANPNIDVNNISDGTKINMPSKNISPQKTPATIKAKPSSPNQEAYENKVEDKRENDVGNEPKSECECDKKLEEAIIKNGFVKNTDFINHRVKKLEHGKISNVNAIVFHRTVSKRYSKPSHSLGAHFYIAKNGKIYQTASLEYTTYHVGAIYSKCYQMGSCGKSDYKKIRHIRTTKSSQLRKEGILSYRKNSRGRYTDRPEHAEARIEYPKAFPERYPINSDSVGIEVVGWYNAREKKWETITKAQKKSIICLTKVLMKLYHIPKKHIYTHEGIKRKTEGEGGSYKDSILKCIT